MCTKLIEQCGERLKGWHIKLGCELTPGNGI
jgi:hypothetical protein